MSEVENFKRRKKFMHFSERKFKSHALVKEEEGKRQIRNSLK